MPAAKPCDVSIGISVVPASIYAAVHLIGYLFSASTNAELSLWLERSGNTLLFIVIAYLLAEGLDLFVWKGLFRKKFGHATPGILIGVSSFLIYLAAAYIIAAAVFDLPITGAVISSGIV